jgi:CBS domain-containing protein
MIQIRSLIQASGQGIFSVTPSDNVFDALKYMAEKNIGAVLVMDGPNTDRAIGGLHPGVTLAGSTGRY